jgi:murein DD-endopeptidase MepM/ murein hydrolase activator NlpD
MDKPVKIGQIIGKTGNTGNANTMKGDDQHLHFEFRKIIFAGTGEEGIRQRFNPTLLYGAPP